MAKYRLTPRALQDLRDIWRHIAVENEKAADKLLGRIFDKLELVSGHPKMGTARPELSATARIFVEGRYIVIYEPMPDGVLAGRLYMGCATPSSG